MTTKRVAAFSLDDLTIVDNMLFKAIRLHHILDPTNDRNRYYRMAFLTSVWVLFSVEIMQVIGLYFTVNDIQRFVFTTTMVCNFAQCMSKAYVIVKNADKLRASLDLARYEFTSCGAQDQSIVRRTRVMSSKILRTYAAISYAIGFFWALTPLFTMDGYLELTNNDGTISRYRITIFNTWLPLPVTVCNTMPVWTLLYVIEAIALSCTLFCWMWFDIYLVTMSCTFNAQFRTVSASCAKIGNRDSFRSPCLSHSNDTQNIKNGDNNTLNFQDELLKHVIDTQNIIKKYDDFFDIIKPAILFPITIYSYSIISLTFLVVLAYYIGSSIISATVIAFFYGLLFFLLELFIYCYIFNHIETEKAKVNFGLYSSNWTAMDLKFKKTLLLAMHMNSAHRRVMNVTPKSILNLEMFSKVLNMSYSILSVLLNSKVKK